ncbi:MULTISPECIES: hypothetical protein [unclassified Leptospira]|uniref:hypothetical protein n=1 Tax=unclassified Leptospira TaxID=2633828 RepID=UPI00029255D7|nr:MULTISPECIES: hypothetical protein [unclassified Leptospira]EKO79952.1 hypothetical protein LEP1GSC068_0397 [Leptospira sp. Fiocruz LV3954]
MKLSDYKPILENEAKFKDMAQLAKIKGYVVLFDLTGSSKLKRVKPFPNWIEDYVPFFTIVTETFEEKTIHWYKFLGDAFLYFIPMENNQNYPKLLKHIPPTEIITLCRKVMDKYWDRYRNYTDKEFKGAEKHINFREITCAIDFGDEIINWVQLLGDHKDTFDPVGKTVDRCFRISSYAGAGQILASQYFFQELVNQDLNEKKRFHKIRIKNGSLKGFEDETVLYYDNPSEEKLDYYIEEQNASLIEDSTEMDIKVKIRLLRQKITSLKEKENGKV